MGKQQTKSHINYDTSENISRKNKHLRNHLLALKSSSSSKFESYSIKTNSNQKKFNFFNEWIETIDLSTLFLQSKHHIQTSEWVGILSISKTTSESSTLLPVRIHEFIGQGTLHLMLPEHIVAVKKSVREIQLRSYLARLSKMQQNRNITLGLIRAEENNVFTNVELNVFSKTYSSSQLIGWSDRLLFDERFDFHVMNPHSELSMRLLDFAKKTTTNRLNMIPDQLNSSELLIMTIHSNNVFCKMNKQSING